MSPSGTGGILPSIRSLLGSTKEGPMSSSQHFPPPPPPPPLRAAAAALPPLVPLPAPQGATPRPKAPQNVPSPARAPIAERTQTPTASSLTPDPYPLTPSLTPRQLTAARL